MESFYFVIPLLYLLFLLGLFTFLLIRGVTHSFIACFAAGALLELIPQLGFLVIRSMPGGFSSSFRSHTEPALGEPSFRVKCVPEF